MGTAIIYFFDMDKHSRLFFPRIIHEKNILWHWREQAQFNLMIAIYKHSSLFPQQGEKI